MSDFKRVLTVFRKEMKETLPTKSNNIGGRGGKRPGAGRKGKGISEKAANGNPGGRVLTVIDVPNINIEPAELEGVDMPKPDEVLSEKQRDGTTLKAAEIYEKVWKYLKRLKATDYISPDMIERYAMSQARYYQCEKMNNELGFLAKHPTTEKPIPSPFVNLGIQYSNQAARQWDSIMQIVKENCSIELGRNPGDELEKLLSERRGF